MELTGTFAGLSDDFITGTAKIEFNIRERGRALDALPGIKDKKLRIKVVQFREKRSLNANSYFHVLCDKLRQKLNISMARCKNYLIASYGQIDYIDGEPIIYKTNAPEEYMVELEKLHTKCIKVSTEKGSKVYYYRIYRGSHTYDSSEMSKLIDGTIQECELQGIETITPAEVERMIKQWGISFQKSGDL